MTIARVLPNVTGLDKSFDYLVPEPLRAAAALGAIVRVELSGRRVGGWIVELDPADALHEHSREPSSLKPISLKPISRKPISRKPISRKPISLKPISKVTGHGPDIELIELSAWAAVRWAGRRRHFLGASSPERAVVSIPSSQRTGRVVEPRSPASTALLEGGGGVLRLPPSSDPKPAIMSAVALGPTLVVVPAADQAMLVGAALRRSGLSVAVLPHDWAAAAGGTDVVIGSRAVAWAPCPGLAAAVVIDEHDEALQDEGSPTWHARDVVIERGRRAGAPVLLVSPCPTLTALEHGPLIRPPVERERSGWPIVDVIDRTDEEPWKRSLVSSRLIDQLRDPDRIVVCVSNTPGRARLLACRVCRTLTRCERCDAAVVLTDDERLACPRCDAVRPPVCLACGGGRFANLRPGVTRLREELEAAAGRPVVEVTGSGPDQPSEAGVYVGTEAVLHRVGRADTVVFLDLDRELLAPRYRAAEQAMGLIVRAARLVGPRSRGGRVLLQTFLPQHDVVQAALLADPGRIVEREREQRRMLGLPPFGALAEIGGAGSDEFVASITPIEGVMIVGGAGKYVARASDWMTLGEAIGTGVRPPHSRLRIAVDPPR